jgi:hypothetical protein
MEHPTFDPSRTPPRVHAELTLARYLGHEFRGDDLRAAILGLPLVLDFIALHHGPEFAWDHFEPHAYVAIIRAIEDEEATFLKALLRESKRFFEYLADRDELCEAHASHVGREIERALAELG